MGLNYSGAAVPLQAADISSAAGILGCDVAAVQAVMTVETGGKSGFLSDGSGRPAILFEAEVFHRLTSGIYDASHPSISSPTWNPALYRGGAAEYVRLEEAAALDLSAAIQSASWGLFQIMGENYELAGYSTPEAWAAGMAASEGNQLSAFVAFCEKNGLAPDLVAHNWNLFAFHYNGPGYAQNNYAAKLASAYSLVTGASSRPLRIGSTGPAVEELQAILIKDGASIGKDGVFGRDTELALQAAQTEYGIPASGVVDATTAATLGFAA